MKYIAIIPARYASSRFPGKALADINGKPMVQHVYEQVSKVLEDVYIATDDERIVKAIDKFGGRSVMTSYLHRSGTDRVQEAATTIQRSRKEDFDVIINVQGDEPFIQPEQIELLQSCFNDQDAQIATLIKKIDKEDIFDPNMVKALIDTNHKALYFSRHPIPYIRGAEEKNWKEKHTYYKHIGIYAYRKKVLNQITDLPPSSLEIAESLEQNRWLENGYTIKTAQTNYDSIGIDTPEDLKQVESMFK